MRNDAVTWATACDNHVGPTRSRSYSGEKLRLSAVEMANAGAISPIRNSETQPYRSGISNWSAVVGPYGDDYDITAADTNNGLTLTNAPDGSYRSSDICAAATVNDKNDVLEKRDFREVTVNLRKFDYIIDRIENLRHGESANFGPKPCLSSVKKLNYGNNDENDDNSDGVIMKGVGASQATVPDTLMNELNSYYEYVESGVANDIDTLDNADTNERPRQQRRRQQWRRRRRRRRRRREDTDIVPNPPNNDTLECRDDEITAECIVNVAGSSYQNTNRGPIRSQFYRSRDRPYFTASWLPRLVIDDNYVVDGVVTDNGNNDYTGASYSGLGRLSCSERANEEAENRSTAAAREWNTIIGDYERDAPETNDKIPLPSIIIDDPEENPFLQSLTRADLESVERFEDSTASSSTVFAANNNNNNNNSILSLTPTSWPESPLGLDCNDVAASRGSSRCSSRTHSPGSGVKFACPSSTLATACSPLDSPQITSMYRIPAGLSSPTSSNHSYGDTPSPLNYNVPLNRRIEERLCDNLVDGLPNWADSYDRAFTTASIQMSDIATDTIDNNQLQLVEEVIRDLGGKCGGANDASGRNGDEAVQVVPNAACLPGMYEENIRLECTYTLGSPVSVSLSCAVSSCKSQEESNYHRGKSSATLNNNTLSVTPLQYCPNSSRACDFYECSATDAARLSYSTEAIERPTQQHYVDESKRNECSSIADGREQRAQLMNNLARSDGCPTRSIYADHQIPKTISTIVESKGSFSRRSDRHIAPWPSLNLPSIKASERLKEGLNAKDVEKAMSNLLKRPIQELASADEDGDTTLMCLVGNPEELARKKAYLVPLVERLTNARGALSRMNNRGEDALYLAAINCPEMPYVTGYLAAAMLQKGIDINQKLYHTRGDTLIHSIAARGDTHGEILAELLALKTTQGHSVFDLSKRNYDGRTALHVAVETHDPIVRGVTAVATVQLLLENGADPRIKETKCGDTALHMATSLSCDPALVKVLLSGKDGTIDVVNILNYNYNTPLHMAAAASSSAVSLEKQKEVCRLLLQAGGQVNIQNRQGKTPLVLVSAERKDIVRRIFHRRA